LTSYFPAHDFNIPGLHGGTSIVCLFANKTSS